ncbi:hypothetical protein V6N11_083047 [Hibiscus sabdariffa]|uniref:Uncharacterized protein n=1 Tax=Hibiscus sabdariffa TaxID=183260 RepID=A0ABR2QKV8_9ROSI
MPNHYDSAKKRCSYGLEIHCLAKESAATLPDRGTALMLQIRSDLKAEIELPYSIWDLTLPLWPELFMNPKNCVESSGPLSTMGQIRNECSFAGATNCLSLGRKSVHDCQIWHDSGAYPGNSRPSMLLRGWKR